MLSQKRVIGPDALGMTPRSVMNSFTYIASCAASEAAMYSASHVDPATTLCLQLHQLTAPPFKIYMYPVCDLESSRSVEASIDVTLYDELFVTSKNEKHILSPLQVF